MFTAIIQAIRNKFCVFLGFRYQFEDSRTPKECFDMPGILLGDDGLTANLSAKCHERACRSLGLALKSATVKRGEWGVEFLSRDYSNMVWFGCPDSCSKVVRAMANFTRTRKGFTCTPEEKLYSKALSLCFTDSNTPGIGPLARKVVELAESSGFKFKVNENLMSWWAANHPVENQYPNENEGNWMDRVVDPRIDIDIIEDYVRRATTLAEILDVPYCGNLAVVAPYPTIPVSVDGELVGAGPHLPAGEVPEKILRDTRSTTKSFEFVSLSHGSEWKTVVPKVPPKPDGQGQGSAAGSGKGKEEETVLPDEAPVLSPPETGLGPVPVQPPRVQKKAQGAGHPGKGKGKKRRNRATKQKAQKAKPARAKGHKPKAKTVDAVT
jgi:hypothetical protein